MKSVERCTLLGILDDGWDGLTPAAQRALTQAGAVIGAARTLDLVAAHLSAAVTRHAMDGQLDALPGWIAAARAEGRNVVVLATGDPLCHGIGAWLGGKLAADGPVLDIVPAPSTLQIAFARLGKPWQDVAIASCHSRDAGEWEFGATPAHGLYPLMRAIARHARVAAFTGPQNTPARLARALVLAGYGDDARLSVACRLRLPDETLFADLTPGEAATMDFPEPNVVLVERLPEPNRPAFGLDDGEYQQRFPEKGLITKQEARALSLAKLRLAPDAVVWDIGAGSG